MLCLACSKKENVHSLLFYSPLADAGFSYCYYFIKYPDYTLTLLLFHCEESGILLLIFLIVL